MVRSSDEDKATPTYSGFLVSDSAQVKDIAKAFAKHTKDHVAGYRQSNMTVDQIAIVSFDI